MNLGIDQSLSGVTAITDAAYYYPTGGNGWMKFIDCPAAATTSNIVTCTLGTGTTLVAYYDENNRVIALTGYEGQWQVLPLGDPLHAPQVGLSTTESNSLTGFAIGNEAYIYYLDVLGRMIELSGALFWKYLEISSPSNAPAGYPGAGITSVVAGVVPSLFYTDIQGNIIEFISQGPGQWSNVNINSLCSAPKASLGFGMVAIQVNFQIRLYYMDTELNLVELRNLGSTFWEFSLLGKQESAPKGAYSNLSAFALSTADLRVYYVNEAREVIEFHGSGPGDGETFSWAWSNISQQIQDCPNVTGQLYAGPGPNSLPQLFYRTDSEQEYPCGQVASLFSDHGFSLPPDPPPPLHWIGSTVCHLVR